jgi:hypothetical protein
MARTARMGDYPVRATRTSDDVGRGEVLSMSRGLDFGGMARVSKCTKKASGVEWIVGSRMRAWRTVDLAIPHRVASPQSPTPLRQARKNSIGATVAPDKIKNRALTRGRLWVTPFPLAGILVPFPF